MSEHLTDTNSFGRHKQSSRGPGRFDGGSISVVLIYLLFGVSWILFSDLLVARMFTDHNSLALAQVIKGWFFILLTALLLYLLVKRRVRILEQVNRQLQQTTTAHQVAEQRLQEFINNAPAVIYAFDREGRLLLSNRSMAAFSGKNGDELQGLLREEIGITPESAQLHRDNDRVVFETGLPQLAEEFNQQQDGLHTYLTIKFPLTMPDGSIYGVAGISTDITAQKKTEELLHSGEERLRFALNVIQAGEWDLNLLDHCALHSLQHDRIFGYHELLPCWSYEIFLEHVLPEDREAVDRAFRHAISEQTDWLFECRIIRYDGEQRWILGSSRHDLDSAGHPFRLVGLIEDITARKEVEAEVLRLNSSLERRVEERTAELAAANRELEAFSYSVSHDLRAPLRAIDGFSLALLEDYGSCLPAEGHTYLERIRKATQRMGALIDDLLQLSRLSRTALRLQQVDLSAMAREIADELNAREPGRQVTWRIAEGVQVLADSSLIRVVLENLLGNAWKFTSKTAQPSISLESCWAGGKSAVCIGDNGVGFEMQYADRLFRPFQRLHSENEFPGSGIGLALVQRIIHRHGGTVAADAKPEGGARFYFSLEGMYE